MWEKLEEGLKELSEASKSNQGIIKLTHNRKEKVWVGRKRRSIF